MDATCERGGRSDSLPAPSRTVLSPTSRATGFMPIHCAVANGRVRMYDILSGAKNHLAPMPSESRLANHQVRLRTRPRRVPSLTDPTRGRPASLCGSRHL